jgi:hypothetical protein
MQGKNSYSRERIIEVIAYLFMKKYAQLDACIYV